MAVALVKAVCLALSTLLNLASRLIFSATAYLLVLVIQAFKVPGQAAQGGLEHIGKVIRSCLEYVLEITTDAMSAAMSYLFDLVKEGIINSGGAISSGMVELWEKTRTSLAEMTKELPEIMESFQEMISTVAADLWNNYKEAIGYVTKNA